jgi:DNA-binding NarL/FixJ family response regulator
VWPKNVTQKLIVALVDAKELRRAAVASLLEEWATSEKVDIVPIAPGVIPDPEQTRMVILSIGNEAIADDEHLRILTTLRDYLPGVPLVVLSDDENVEHAAVAIRMDIRGYIQTDIRPELAGPLLSSLLRGGSYFPIHALQHLVAAWSQTERDDGSRAMDANSNDAENAGTRIDDNPIEEPLHPRFTGRQKEVVNYLRLGSSNKAIARQLGLTETSVKVHVRTILRKLGAVNRTQAAVVLLQSDDPDKAQS